MIVFYSIYCVDVFWFNTKLAKQSNRWQLYKWLTDIEIKGIRWKLERNNGKVEVQDNDQEII